MPELHVQKEVELDTALGGGIELPIQCGPDGRIYVRFINEDGTDQRMVSIGTDGSITNFSLPYDSGLQNAIWMSDHATEDSVFAHIKGVTETKLLHLKTSSGQDVGARKVGPISDYLFSFALDGKFKARVQLDIPFEVLQVASFPSGMILAAGLDKTTNKPIVALASEIGTFLRPISLKGDLQAEIFKPDDNALKGMGTLEAKLQSSTLIPDGREILLVRNETDAPVFAIAQSGSVRTVQVRSPAGYKIFSITPSRDGWMTQFVKDLGKGRVLAKLSLVDRQTGAVLRSFETDVPVGLGFACYESGGNFLFLKGGTIDKPDRATLLIASPR